jgi:hypothetical protein
VKALLEFYLKFLDFLYLDSRYGFTDSKTDGVNASLTVTGPNITWLIVNDRGQMQLTIAPTSSPNDGFWISLIRQYLDEDEDIQYLSAVEEIAWARANSHHIDQLFSAPHDLEATCDALRALQRSNAEKHWGPAGDDRMKPHETN